MVLAVLPVLVRVRTAILSGVAMRAIVAGDPGTVDGGPFPFPLPGSAKAADAPTPAISRPTIEVNFATFSVQPVMWVLSSRPWVCHQTLAIRTSLEAFPLSGSWWSVDLHRPRHEGPDVTRPWA